ncbi:hypothetical protein H0963_004329 [Salmonella enterica]|nr:hypothetical protein [Salmonella enterica]
MNKGQYRAARRLIRDNGIYALRWLDDDTALDDVEADRVQRGAAGENWFKCECCKTHSFSERHIYAGKKRGDEVR